MRRTVVLSLTLGCLFAARVFAEDESPRPDETRRAEVVATVGDKTITVGDIEDVIASRRPPARRRLVETPDAIKNLADAQIQNELFYQGAQKLGFANDPEVERFVDQTMVKVFVRKEFEETVTPDDVPEGEVTRYYSEHPDEFRRPEMRRARHILVASKKEAKEIRELLSTDEAQTFRALAKKRSIDTETSVRGGDLLYFDAAGDVVGRNAGGKVDATLVEAAFSLKKTGELSPPLDLGDGKWSVLELTGIRLERVQSLEQARDHVRRKLWREERKGALEALLTKLREEVKPEIYPERIDAIVLKPASVPVELPNQ